MRHDAGEYFESREEKRLARQDRLAFAAGISNFFSVIMGIVMILVLVLLVLSLLNWLRNDIAATFTILGSQF